MEEERALAAEVAFSIASDRDCCISAGEEERKDSTERVRREE